MDYVKMKGIAICPKCKREFNWKGIYYDEIIISKDFDEIRKYPVNCEGIRYDSKCDVYIADLICPNCNHSFCSRA